LFESSLQLTVVPEGILYSMSVFTVRTDTTFRTLYIQLLSTTCFGSIDTAVAVFTEKVYLTKKSASSRIRICIIFLTSRGNRIRVFMTNVNKIQGESIYYDFKQRHFCSVIGGAIIRYLQ